MCSTFPKPNAGTVCNGFVYFDGRLMLRFSRGRIVQELGRGTHPSVRVSKWPKPPAASGGGGVGGSAEARTHSSQACNCHIPTVQWAVFMGQCTPKESRARH